MEYLTNNKGQKAQPAQSGQSSSTDEVQRTNKKMAWMFVLCVVR
jgi:hypothetical protein